MLRFFKGLQRVRVWDHERKGDGLVEFNLGIKETDGFSFSQTESLKDFHGLLLQVGINTSVDAVRQRHLSSFSHVPSTPFVVLMKDDYLWYSCVIELTILAGCRTLNLCDPQICDALYLGRLTRRAPQ